MTMENDVNLAALGERWRGVARDRDDFAFLSIGTGLGAGLVLRGELHRGHHGAAGEVDYAFGVGLERDIDPCAAALVAFVADLAERGAHPTALTEPFALPAVFAAARAGDELARAAVAEEARRIALHIAPIAAVADIGLVVIGGGIGSNGDLLLAGPGRARVAAPVPAARGGLEPGRRRGAERRALGGAGGRARVGVREPPRRGVGAAG
jgi:predicted NBD/HSP70 family sugar kinase